MHRLVDDRDELERQLTGLPGGYVLCFDGFEAVGGVEQQSAVLSTLRGAREGRSEPGIAVICGRWSPAAVDGEWRGFSERSCAIDLGNVYWVGMYADADVVASSRCAVGARSAALRTET